MKKFLPFLLTPLLFQGCSTDLEVTADWKEVPVVYGLLNKVDNVQYIKVNKGFLDQNTDALQIAQIPDSIYYQDSIIVRLEVVNGTSYDLSLTLAPPKEDGIFATEPNYVYSFSQPINDTKEYRLTVENKATGKIVSSQTKIVKNFSVSRPPEDDPDFEVNFASSTPFSVQWFSAENGRIYELELEFRFTEWNVSMPGEIDTVSVSWRVFSNKASNGIFGNEPMNFPIEGKSFYAYLRSQLKSDSQIRRKALDEPLSFHFYVGGQELYDYIRINRAQTGITQLQVKPEFTNINGGLGLFSSRFSKSVNGVKLHKSAIDSLSCGSITGELNFVNKVCN